MTRTTLQIDGLRPAQLRAVKAQADREGKTPAEYVRALIERDLLARRSFDVILAPVRADVQARGISEADVDAVVEKARRAVTRPSRRARQR